MSNQINTGTTTRRAAKKLAEAALITSQPYQPDGNPTSVSNPTNIGKSSVSKPLTTGDQHDASLSNNHPSMTNAGQDVNRPAANNQQTTPTGADDRPSE